MRLRVVNLWVALWFVLVAAGCAETMTTVGGKVTLDGKPLVIEKSQRGTVVFHPVGGGALATALVRGDGSYRATTGGSSPLAVGEYLVAVRVLEVIPRTESAEATGRPLTPALYADPTTSGLRFDIKQGANVCDIALRSGAGPVMPAKAAQNPPEPPADDAPVVNEDGASF